MNKPDNSQEQVRSFLLDYQDRLCASLEDLDGQKTFTEDRWERDSLGYGRTRVLHQGGVFESGGVNFSEVTGQKLPQSLLGHYTELDGQSFWGLGVSMVLHPRNPYCPTVHLNYRYFEAGTCWWFGGGCDLTPYYGFDDDCRHWHGEIKRTLDLHHTSYYPAFKYWCDEYFYNHHRGESRGIGGVFYDYQDGRPGQLIKIDHARKSEDIAHKALESSIGPRTWEEMFAFQRDNANIFFSAYLPIARRRDEMKWGEAERAFQLYRRGRYVEFNLLHDRGTRFGIDSQGRAESILMSLPPLVRWEYGFQAAEGSAESKLVSDYLRKEKSWI